MKPTLVDPPSRGEAKPALLLAAVKTLQDSGVTGASLREVARRAGVTHAAATYHFGDKVGLLTAVAAEGYRMLSSAIGEAYAAGSSGDDLAVVYVTFALENRAHYDVMFRPELLRANDPEFLEAASLVSKSVHGTKERSAQEELETFARWSMIHGMIRLIELNNLPESLRQMSVDDLARSLLAYLPTLEPARGR